MPKRYKGKLTLPAGPAPIKRKLQHSQAVSAGMRKKAVTLAAMPAQPPKEPSR